MDWKPRRETLPSDVHAALGLARGERVLAFGRAVDGVWLIGTDRSLYIGADDFVEIPWERVEHATWSSDDSALVVEEVADFGETHPRHVVRLDDPRRLLQLVRERVTASILLTRNVPIAGTKGLQIVTRRSPLRTGDIEFSFWLGDGLDPSDEAVLDARRRGLEQARVDLGL
ncbi:hypothetical protein [Solicola gregarius]|uniref:Uncharacterized protein n=1 Tax=Solicola gregarius TaxID=2908642 RepID=A0AA46TI16_9ACTN|nr:hypothetical protein [Solicola gregarius]UYM05686.1 hypothetical protein L0C25_00990 [Solicola gregarius]